MAEVNGPYLYATTHDFKSNIARYMRLLESGAYEAVFIKHKKTRQRAGLIEE